jgi:hypothetical protein
MDGPLWSKPRTLPSSEATRRELLEVAAVTGGILVAGGHLGPGASGRYWPSTAVATLIKYVRC